MRDAKLLQKNVFMSFEKMDEMSQRYVADVEAGMDTCKETATAGANFIAQVAMFYLMFKTNAKNSLNNMIKGFYPLLAPIAVAIPMNIKSTQIQKQANKIGVMEAMQDLQDPRLFVQDKN